MSYRLPRQRRPARRPSKTDARLVWPPHGRQSARDAIEALMRERGQAREFGREVKRAADRVRDRGLEVRSDIGARRDLTDLPTFTIDPLSARDFDDAISAELRPEGAVRIWVHIADVSAYVSAGSPVDLEARRRATSVYVPGGVEPMLPGALSSDACSLVPGSERLAVTAQLELHGEKVTRASFYRSVVRSDERLDYERVDRIFAGREAAAEPWREPLAAARAAAAQLQRARERSGALVIDSEEPEFVFDDRGEVREIRARVQTESHRLIEHLMIAANEAVARLLHRHGVPCLYRVHERPEPEAVERLVAQLASLEVPTPPLPERISRSQAAELIGAISRLVDAHVRRTGRGRIALGTLVLRSLKQAYYSPKNLGHAGLRSASYCHFTSPIRRYPDLVCHRALLSAVGGGERAPRAAELVELGAWSSERERDAMMIERDADDIARCFLLEQQLYERGWEQEFTGEVTGLISAGAFVAFGGPVAGLETAEQDAGPAGTSAAQVFEGMLPVREMHLAAAHTEGGSASQARSGSAGARARQAGARRSAARVGPRSTAAGPARDWWELNELGTILHGERSGATVRLGDLVKVRVARVDAPRGRVDLTSAAAPTPRR